MACCVAQTVLSRVRYVPSVLLDATWGVSVRSIRLVAISAVLAVVAGCGSGDGGRAAAPPPAPTTTSAAPAPTGSHTSTHSAPPAAPLRAGERFTTLTVEREYAPKAPPGASDEYRCFLVDPGLNRRAYLTGSRIVPGNADLAHHVIVYRVPPADVAEARRLDAAAAEDGWTCFGGTGIGGNDPSRRLAGGSDWVSSWVPGAEEWRTPASTGYVLEPGAQLVMQVHYNLLRSPPGATDRSGVRLRLADGTRPVTPLRANLLAAPIELPCAPGETGVLCNRTSALLDTMRRFGEEAGTMVAGLSTLCSNGKAVPGPVQRCDYPIKEAATVYAAAGHMHLLGTSITIEVNPGKPDARTLLDVSPYNFHDQRILSLPKPVKVEAGDTFRVTCTHDASIRKNLAELQGLPPRYVVWGDGTADEMCLGITVTD